MSLHRTILSRSQLKELFYSLLGATRRGEFHHTGHVDVRGRFLDLPLQLTTVLLFWQPRDLPGPSPRSLFVNTVEEHNIRNLAQGQRQLVISYMTCVVDAPLSCEPRQELSFDALSLARWVAPLEVLEYPLSSLYAMEHPTSDFAEWLGTPDEKGGRVRPCSLCGSRLPELGPWDAPLENPIQRYRRIVEQACLECGWVNGALGHGPLSKPRLFALKTRQRGGRCATIDA